jgi:hypothetical protein
MSSSTGTEFQTSSREPGARPALSVVIVMLAGPAGLRRCLDALSQQEVAARPEIIVPHPETLDATHLKQSYPAVCFVGVPGRPSHAQMRAAGLHHARGRIVAFTEDHCTPDAKWCANILALHRNTYAAVGGAVDKAGPDSALNWAIYLSDFGRYMLPVREGPASYLTDCNVSYKRVVLEPLASLWNHEFHETTVNWTLLQRGQVLFLSPRVIVREQRDLRLGYALRERYAFARVFANTRVAAVGWARRWLYAAFSFLLPAILIGRIMKNVIWKRRALRYCLRALPFIVLINVVWAFGEFVGYVAGSAPAQRAAQNLAEPALRNSP